MRYIKVFFQKIVAKESSDYCYAYSNSPSYTASITTGGATESFNVTVRSSSTTKPVEQITLWLSDIPDEDALAYCDTIGSTAYLQIDANNQMTLLSDDEFQNLSAKEQKNVVTQLAV